MELEGASAIVTGAGRGIGRAIAIGLGRAGARVTLVARTASDLEAVAKEVREAGGEALVVAGDVTQRGFPEKLVEAAAAQGRLQILVNNAGIGSRAPLAEMTDDAWDTLMETNLHSVFRLTRAALPQLRDGGGHVVMISSLAGRNPIAGMSAYCASKAALDHMTACLMLEVRHEGVKVSTVAPGSVDTGFGSAAGMDPSEGSWKLTAEDVAAQVLALLEMRHDAHSSRVEMRPLRPKSR